MKKILSLIALLSIAFAVTACKKGGGDEEGPGNPYEERYGDTPQIDCANFNTRIQECPDDFFTAYAATEAAIRAGEGDGATGAGYLRAGLRIMEEYCRTDLFGKDLHWHDRYNQCLTNDACGGWAACAAVAIGDPLGPPDL